MDSEPMHSGEPAAEPAAESAARGSSHGRSSAIGRAVHAVRTRLRSHPVGRLVFRVIVTVVGVVLVVGGLILVPLPGPGWLIVILGLVVLASEFTWAERLLDRVRRALRRWTHRSRRSHR